MSCIDETLWVIVTGCRTLIDLPLLHFTESWTNINRPGESICLVKHGGYESLVTWQQEPTYRSKYKYLKRAASQMAVLICGGLCDTGVGFTVGLYFHIHNMIKRGLLICYLRIVSRQLTLRSMSDRGICFQHSQKICITNLRPFMFKNMYRLLKRFGMCWRPWAYAHTEFCPYCLIIKEADIDKASCSASRVLHRSGLHTGDRIAIWGWTSVACEPPPNPPDPSLLNLNCG